MEALEVVEVMGSMQEEEEEAILVGMAVGTTMALMLAAVVPITLELTKKTNLV